MSSESPYLDYVLELLAPHGPVRSKRFFGGTGLVANGHQFGMVMKDSLYFCVSAGNRRHFEAHGMGPFSYATRKGRVEVKRYYEVPAEVIEEPELLREWLHRAMGDATA